MTCRKTSCLLVAALFVCGAAHGHFIWLEIDPGNPEQVRLRFAEEILDVTPADMQALAAPMKVKTADGATVEMSAGDEFMRGAIKADSPFVTGTQDYGVLDRSEFGRGRFMLYYHARAARDTKAAGQASTLPVDVTASVESGELIVTVRKGGEPAQGADVFVILPHELNPEVATADAKGQARFKIADGDWCAVRAMVPEEASGEHNGESFELVHHYSTLSFYHAGE